MATIKSFTDISQSKKLAEILPLESADMYYISGDECDICFGRGVYEEIADWICEGIPKPADIPCWSLAALLGVLSKIGAEEPMVRKLYYTNEPKERYICQYSLTNITSEYNNPVDACYEMIIRLHELNLL